MEENKQPEVVEVPKEEPKINIFAVENIDEIYNGADPINKVRLLLESNYRRVFKRADFETDKILAKAEFFVNTLIFLKQTFQSFENETLCKLLNLFDILLDMSEATEDFLALAKKKLTDFKSGLDALKLIPKKKGEVKLANAKDKKISPDGSFFLNIKEINELISYLKTDYLPYLRMWYYFEKEERDIKNETIEIIVNKPIPSMPLNMAEMQKEEKPPEEAEVEQEKLKTEEEKEAERQKEEVKEEEKKSEEPETYLDILNRLNLNAETRKIIIEKIEELHKDVDGKIEGRKKTLEDKIKEIEDTVKGKKK